MLTSRRRYPLDFPPGSVLWRSAAVQAQLLERKGGGHESLTGTVALQVYNNHNYDSLSRTFFLAKVRYSLKNSGELPACGLHLKSG